MAIQKLRYFSDPSLHRPSEPVLKTDEVKQIVEDLADTLYSSTGVGISAPQIGINKRVCIYDVYRRGLSEKRNYKVLVNPKIVDFGTKLKTFKEGCKSTPDLFVNSRRSCQIEVEGFDQNWNKIAYKAKNLEAEIIQHEIDHMDGKLIPNETSKIVKKRNLYHHYRENLEKIINKLFFLRDLKDGFIHKEVSSFGDIFLYKEGNQVHMYFFEDGKFSGIMSRVDITHPLILLGVYSRAVMLSLLFVQNPKNMYLIGFGGGRIPMIFNHFFPEIKIESTEIDSKVISLAEKYFGITYDERMKVYDEDGRDFLQKQSFEKKYEIIIIDSFVGNGKHPYSLSTKEFYDLCKNHLEDDGIVVQYLIDNDIYILKKRLTFIASFSKVFEWEENGSHVLFGMNKNDIKIDELEKIAKNIDSSRNYSFELSVMTKDFKDVSQESISSEKFILTDENNNDINSNLSKISRNELCPCGSGKKFKKCHGLMK